MTAYLPYLLVSICYILFFLRSKGFFRASARFLRTRFDFLSACASEHTLTRALVILFLANLMGAALQYESVENDTAARGYLIRGEYGETDDTAELALTLDGERKDVDLSVRARQMSRGEINAALEEAEKRLPLLMLGGMQAEHVDDDVSFPEKIDGLPVKISWMTNQSEVLNWDGEIGDAAAAKGTDVTVTAEIVCEDELRETEFSLRVFPKRRTEAEVLMREVMSAVEAVNDETEEYVTLPETIGGRRASWTFRSGSTGLILLLLGIMISVVYVYSRIRVRELEEEKRVEQLRLDYPNLVSKLVLLVSAGMSTRRAFEKMRADYQRQVSQGGGTRAGYEEIVRTAQEMEHGVSEMEAYVNLGKRCAAAEYRTFASLLAQSVTRGGSELTKILRQEAYQAYEERKKRARVLGEEAGTKLLLPMLLMLVVVMVILMVPAFLAFL